MSKLTVGDRVRIVKSGYGYTSTKIGSEGIVIEADKSKHFFRASWYKLTGEQVREETTREWIIAIDAVEVIEFMEFPKTVKEQVCDKIREIADKRKALGYKY